MIRKKIYMNLKEELIKKRNKLLKNYGPTYIPPLKSTDKMIKPIDLNKKIEEFIEWDEKNIIDIYFRELGRPYVIYPDHNHKIVKKLIEKMAIWYELRYPDYEIDRIFNDGDSNNEKSIISKNIFIDNPYIKDNFNDPNRIKQSEIHDLKWEELYNKEVFINSLSDDEREVLTPKYPSIVFVYKYPYTQRLNLSSDGVILKDDSHLSNEDLTGKNIEEIPKIIKNLSKENEIVKEIEIYARRKFIKEQMLNCVMYKIIENGSSIYGPRRALLFAKEFNINIDIPMMYGLEVSTDSTSLVNFINKYLEFGGNTYLVCYTGYFEREDHNNKSFTRSLEKELKFQEMRARAKGRNESRERIRKREYK